MIWALSYIAPMLLLFEHLALFCQLGVKYARYVSEVEKNYERQKVISGVGADLLLSGLGEQKQN